MIKPEDWRPKDIEDLEPAAWGALCQERTICVTAGPGAGKTEFLAQKATYLLQTGLCPAPFHILAVSFKRDAADNLMTRVRSRCPSEQARRFHSMTFDSFTKGLVDRFHSAIPKAWRPSRRYEVTFPKKQAVEHFLTATRLSAPVKWQRDIVAMSVKDFETQALGLWRLTEPRQPPRDATEFAVQRWWDEYLRSAATSRLTFVMLNRLAELLLRTRLQIRRALRATYPVVFLDEFQDTTYAQFDFLLTALRGSPAAITAVGDDKQRIMVWAGARPDAFQQFHAEFGGERAELLFNHRSSPGLVRIQHVVARALDGRSPEVVSKASPKIDGDVAELWSFVTEPVESARVVSWIRDDMSTRGLNERDYAILVRQKADRFEEQLAGPFADAGLGLRNESKKLGRTTLQDVLAEDVTRVVLAILRLATQRRAPDAWILASAAVSALRGVDPRDAVAGQKAETELKAAIGELRDYLTKVKPDSDTARNAALRVVTFLDTKALAQTYREYATGDDLEIAIEALTLFMSECAESAGSWTEVLDRFEGSRQVPLIVTAHA